MTNEPTVMKPSEESVIPGLEAFEVVYAKDQPEYLPLRALKSMKDDGAILTRWTFTDEQRKAIAEGDDLWLEVLTFYGALQPLRLIIGRPFQNDVISGYGLVRLSKEGE